MSRLTSTPDSLLQPLTPREQDVLEGVGDGLTNRQIAERLSFALSTVKWYVRQIYNKLGVANREEAIARAQLLGLLPDADKDGARPHNLTAAATPLIGRAQALAALNTLVTDSQTRLLTIVGPGGIGKTRLALACAHQQLQHAKFKDGVFFVTLAPVATADGLLPALAAALNFQFHGSRPEAEQLLSYLSHKQMLLLLDNFEHLLDARPFLVEINRQAAGITLLLTSRERLQLLGEQHFPLLGLQHVSTAESQQQTAAAQLFLNVARRNVPDFELSNRDAETLNRICQLVQGMPLALELAGTWVGMLPLAAIEAEIEQSLSRLTSQHHDVPLRHRSMQAALAVSWGQLNHEQQQTFAALTIFRGGFTRAAAAQVAGATLPLLMTLINKSWLTYDLSGDRYQIHELLRQFGAAMLKLDSDREQLVQANHSRFFCAFLKARESDWFSAREPIALRQIQADIENVQIGWRWAAVSYELALLSLGLDSLCRFYELSGQLGEGQRACRLVDVQSLQSSADTHSDPSHGWRFQARILAWLALFSEDVAQKERLISQSQASLERIISGGQDSKRDHAHFYLKKAQSLPSTDLTAAIDSASLGLSLFNELDDVGGQIESLALLGTVHMNQGNLDRAAAMMQRGLHICRQQNYAAGEAEFEARYSQVLRYRGEFAESEARLRQSLRLARRLKNRYRELTYLTTLSFTLSFAGNFAAAKQSAQKAVELNASLRQKPDDLRLNCLAKATLHLGQYSEAEAAGLAALQLASQLGHRDNAGWASMYLGSIALAQGALTEAESQLNESISYLAELKHTYRNMPQAILSYVQRALGNRQSAQQLLLEPLRSAIQQRSVSPLMKLLPVAALLAADDGRLERAVELYGAACQFEHVTNSRWSADVACRNLDAIYARLPPDTAAAAFARGQTHNVWETARRLMAELTA